MPRRTHSKSKDDRPKRPPGPRPFWSGTITFGLVSVPVEIYALIRPNRISMKTLGPDGQPLKRRYFCSKDGKKLNSEEITRGYEREDGSFVTITDKELQKLAPRKSRDIDLRRFVDREAIPLSLLERPYILAPAGDSTRAYALLAATMEKSGKAGIATFVMREKEYLTAIVAENGLLLAATMRFSDELRTPEEIGLPEPVSVSAKDLKSATASLKKLNQGKLNPDLLRNVDSEQMLALADRKRQDKNSVVEVEAEKVEPDEESDNIVDIMSVLKRRMLGESPKAQTEQESPSFEDLEDQSTKELYDRAQDLGVEGRSKMSRSELIAAIKSAA